MRLATGELCWFVGATSLAYPKHGEIVVVDWHSAFPCGNRYVGALAVRSLQDLIETVNAETITSIDEDGTIHIYGELDGSRGEVVREPETGIILWASGIEGESP